MNLDFDKVGDFLKEWAEVFSLLLNLAVLFWVRIKQTRWLQWALVLSVGATLILFALRKGWLVWAIPPVSIPLWALILYVLGLPTLIVALTFAVHRVRAQRDSLGKSRSPNEGTGKTVPTHEFLDFEGVRWEVTNAVNIFDRTAPVIPRCPDCLWEMRPQTSVYSSRIRGSRLWQSPVEVLRCPKCDYEAVWRTLARGITFAEAAYQEYVAQKMHRDSGIG